MKIYVIQGSTGEYSDHREWLVKAFRTEEAAKAEVTRLSEFARLAEIKRDGEYWSDAEWKANAPEWAAADPHRSTDYTGTFYGYETVELEDV